MIFLSARALASLVFVCLICGVGLADDSPQFLGHPISSTAQVPELRSFSQNWSESTNLAWKMPIPGRGWSSPITTGSRVFVTTAVDPVASEVRTFENAGGIGSALFSKQKPKDTVQWRVLCLDRETGAVLWNSLAAEGRPRQPAHAANSFASETPATDGRAVYAWFAAAGRLVAFDLTGKELWAQEIGAFKMGMGWGHGSSIALADGRIFLLSDNEEHAFVRAYDTITGNELWNVDRGKGTAWSSPYLWKNELRSELIACGAERVTSYNPKDGQPLWDLTGFKASFIATPVGDAQQLYLGNNGPFSKGQLFALNAGATGTIVVHGAESQSRSVAWGRTQSGPGIASPLLWQGRIYVTDYGNNLVGCYDAATGERLFRERVPGAKAFNSSPWHGNGLAYLLDESGQCFGLKPGRELEIVATNRLDDVFWASPAVGRTDLILRGAEHLYCIRGSGALHSPARDGVGSAH